MEYQFSVDTLNRPRAQFAMEQDAFGDWFSDEVKRDQALISRLLSMIDELERHQRFDFEWTGVEFQLRLDRQEAELISLTDGDDTFDIDLVDADELSEDERHCGCGLDDFKRALIDWQEFVAS